MVSNLQQQVSVLKKKINWFVACYVVRVYI
jgi:hypothetical protein